MKKNPQMSDGKCSSHPSRSSIFSNFEIERVTPEERTFLHAARQGDVGMLRQILDSDEGGFFNPNCMDFMGRNALHLAVDSESVETIELLLEWVDCECVEQALLHAISKHSVTLVKVIVEHPSFISSENQQKRQGSDAFFGTEEKSQFPPDISPLVLAAHYNNHEIIQIFLARNHTIEKPHRIDCTCNVCQVKQHSDSLKRSRSRLNAYRALASPAYIALSQPDPIMATFELRRELITLASTEKEFKNEYVALADQCMEFACEMMDLCRGTREVEAVLADSSGENPMARLQMAIKYEEKKFVSHPNCQQHLTRLWYADLRSLQSLSFGRKLFYGLVLGPVIPVISLLYIIAPNSKVGSWIKSPVCKFINHTVSHLIFIALLTAATYRFDHIDLSGNKNSTDTNTCEGVNKLRPDNEIFTNVQICIIFWIVGLLWVECKQIYSSGMIDYFTAQYNLMDSAILAVYIASYSLRYLVHLKVQEAKLNYFPHGGYMCLDNNTKLFSLLNITDEEKGNREAYFMEADRFRWDMSDPETVSDVLFAIANILSIARTTFVMPAHEMLGPLQITLTSMLGFITRFLVLFSLVLFAFMVGLNNLYWYYGTRRVQVSVKDKMVTKYASEYFHGLQESVYSLFWAMFGLFNLNNIKILHPYKERQEGDEMHDFPWNPQTSTTVVETTGYILFAAYDVAATIVLVNMLIAMMTHSFEAIQGDCDLEWKFARTKLWMTYIDEGSSLAVPFNVIPTPKSLRYAWRWLRGLDCCTTEDAPALKYAYKRRDAQVIENIEINTTETMQSDILMSLVRRYLFKKEREREDDTKKKIASDEILEISDEDFDESKMGTITEEATGPAHGKNNLFPTSRTNSSNSTGSSDASISPPFQRKGSGHSGGSFRRSSRRTKRRTSVASADSQLSAITRNLRLLDARLQDLQASSRSDWLRGDMDHQCNLLVGNQSALLKVVKAMSEIQSALQSKPPQQLSAGKSIIRSISKGKLVAEGNV